MFITYFSFNNLITSPNILLSYLF